jgi:hypothetical protein
MDFKKEFIFKNGFYKTKSNDSMTYSTFEIIGEGAFGIVILYYK